MADIEGYSDIIIQKKKITTVNCILGAQCKELSTFSYAPKPHVGLLLVVLYVLTQQMFSGSVLHTVLCVQRTIGIFLFFCYSGFGDTDTSLLDPE